MLINPWIGRNARCLLRSSDCVLLSRDLDRDGISDQLLCNLDPMTLLCAVYQRDDHDQWQWVGEYDWQSMGRDQRTATAQALRDGQIQVVTPKMESAEGRRQLRVVPCKPAVGERCGQTELRRLSGAGQATVKEVILPDCMALAHHLRQGKKRGRKESR